MTNETLLQAIQSAFSATRYPGTDEVVYDNSGKHLECIEVREAFKDNVWTALPADLLDEQQTSLFFMSHRGFAYYLPAFMTYVVADFDRGAGLADNLIAKLTLPIDMDVAIMAQAIKSTKLDQQMPEVDFLATLQNQLEGRNQDVHNFIARAALLSFEQGWVVQQFLTFLATKHADEYPNNEPTTAIDRYWFQFG